MTVIDIKNKHKKKHRLKNYRNPAHYIELAR